MKITARLMMLLHRQAIYRHGNDQQTEPVTSIEKIRAIRETRTRIPPDSVYHDGRHPMFTLDPYSILAGFIFSTIGLGAFSYGKKLDLWHPRLIGGVLLLYPYFISNAWLLWGIGLGLLVLLWFYHYE